MTQNADNPIYGDALNLAQGGQLSFFGLTLYNTSSFGNTDPILTGSTEVKFYDNTVPYTGGSLSASNTLLGTGTVNWDFTGSGGLQPDFFSTQTVDFTSLNITLTAHILVAQEFTETSGGSTANGVVLFSDPTIGTSPANVYFKDSSSEGLTTIGVNNPNQIGYHVEIVPEPETCALAGLGIFGLLAVLCRRKQERVSLPH